MASSTAEAASSRRVVREGPPQVVLAEVWPERLHEDELRVGQLPEQEVREPQLARGADEQVGIRELGRVEVSRQRVLVHILGVGSRLEQASRRLDELGAAAVVERDPER